MICNSCILFVKFQLVTPNSQFYYLKWTTRNLQFAYSNSHAARSFIFLNPNWQVITRNTQLVRYEDILVKCMTKSTDASKRFSANRNQTIAFFRKFYGKTWVVFVLTQESAFSKRFHFKANKKSIGSSEKLFQGFSKWSSVWEIGRFFIWKNCKTWTFSIF